MYAQSHRLDPESRVTPKQSVSTLQSPVPAPLSDPAVDELCRLLARIVLRLAAVEPTPGQERAA